MAKECNCPSCRGEGPPDEPEMPEVSDEFLEEWIGDESNRDTIAEKCAHEIDAAWSTYLEGQIEEAAISRAENRAEAEKYRDL
jgi:hypothetical protein